MKRFLQTMNVPHRFFRFSCMLALCTVLAGFAGCTDSIWRGQVATVNGSPISLDQVTALRNSTHFDWNSPPLEEMEVMRKQYGDALTNLVAVELVKQQLEKKKLSVTMQEVLAVEKNIRADYPEGTFDEVLVEEAIDLETWRFLLRNHLSVQRFLEKIIRPEIMITLEEADAYRKAHPTEFTRPPWAYFFLVSGTDKAEVARCAKKLDMEGDPVAVQQHHPETLIRTVRLDLNRLNPVFSQIIAGLAPGDLSAVFDLGGEYHQILLLETLPERQAKPNEAYAQITEALMEQKVQAAYNLWIRNRISKATIKVSHQLLPHFRSMTGPLRSGGEPALP